MLLQRPKQNSATTASIPAPIGGWNGRDSLAEMPPTDAVQMVNFYPTPSDVTLRKGYTQVSIVTTSTGAKTISSITHSGVTATVTTATAHGLIDNEYISVSGATPSDYNGVFMIKVTGASTFTYTMLSVPATNATVVGAYTIKINTPIHTLMDYPTNSGYKLFGACGNTIYDCKPATAVSYFTGITSDKLQFVNFTNTAGSFVVGLDLGFAVISAAQLELTTELNGLLLLGPYLFLRQFRLTVVAKTYLVAVQYLHGTGNQGVR